MSHSEPQASTPQTGGGPPVFNGTYDTTSLLQEKRAASPTYQKEGGVLNVKAGKSHKKDRPKPHRPVPYFKSAIRADREDHQADTSGTPSSSGAESERPTKRLQSSAPKKPKSSADRALAGIPVATVPTFSPGNAPVEMTVPAMTVPAATTTNIFQPPPPPVAPNTAYTLTLPLASSTTHPSVQQVPLHLVHPKMLPEPLLKFIQTLYFQEQSVSITIEEAVNQWARLGEGHRIEIVTLYGRSVAHEHAHERDRAFEATIQPAPSRRSGRRLTTAPAPAAQVQVVQASAEASSIAAQVASRTASQGLISGYSTASSGTVSSAPESSFEDLNMEIMEEVVQNTTVPAQVPYEDIDIDIDDEIDGETSASMSGTSSVVRRSSRNKGKGRAQNSVDEDEADDESDMMEDDPEETVSTPRHSTPTPLPQPAMQAVGSSLDARIGLLLARKIESLDQSIRDQNAWYKEQAESNRAFQQAMLAEFQNMRSNQGTAQGGTSATFSPNTPKPTRINAAVLKAMQRSAKARKQELELTPEQLEHQHKILMRSRLQGHLRALLKVNDLKDLVVRHPTLTEDEVKAWESGNGTIVCTPENLRVDFDRKWKQFSLNKVARRLVLFTFRKKADAGTFALFPPTPAMLTDEYLGPILDQYMKTLRRCYRETLNPPDEAARQELLRRRAQNARMNTLLQTRVFVIIHMNYNQHSILFMRMSAANMSGDETDGPEVTHPPVYRIIIADWQSLELRTFLWALDAKYLAYWAKPPTRRRTGGNPARHRVKRDDSKTIPGVAPIGLWRNCYNSAWLDTLQDWEVELLEIVEEDYDFTLDPPATTSGSAGPSRRR